MRGQRVRFHIGGGLAHGIIMGRIHDNARLELEAELELAQRVAAQRSLPQVAIGEPPPVRQSAWL